jgi:hypothetical protein
MDVSPMTRLLLLLLLFASSAVGARMYQWQDPQSKSVQFSGVPPAWYRSPEGGPRVRVYDGGKLVDDTSIPLSEQDNASMRELAFRELQEERQLAAIKRLDRAARREAQRQEQAKREALRAQAASEQSDTSEAPPEVLQDSLSADEVGRLKAIIAEFDRLNSGPRASQVARSQAASQSAATESSAGGTTKY